MLEIKMENPKELPDPYGPYTHIARLKNHHELIFIAGQLSVDKEGNIEKIITKVDTKNHSQQIL